MFFLLIVNGTDTFAVLHYEGASDAEPTAPQPTGLAPGGIEFEEYQMKVVTFVSSCLLHADYL